MTATTMDTINTPTDSVPRLERQLLRLRDLLAEAWVRECPRPVIQRLEGLIQGRWGLLERTRHRETEPQPA